MAAVPADTPVLARARRARPDPDRHRDRAAARGGSAGAAALGLAARHGVTVLNTPGTIDADYRGEVQVILVNFGSDSFAVTRGMRMPSWCRPGRPRPPARGRRA